MIQRELPEIPTGILVIRKAWGWLTFEKYLQVNFMVRDFQGNSQSQRLNITHSQGKHRERHSRRRAAIELSLSLIFYANMGMFHGIRIHHINFLDIPSRKPKSKPVAMPQNASSIISIHNAKTVAERAIYALCVQTSES
jgi:hypothetical protein